MAPPVLARVARIALATAGLGNDVGAAIALVLQGRPAPRTRRSRVPTSPVRTHLARVRAPRTPPVRGAALA